MLVDSHCHINFSSYKGDGDAVIGDFLRDNHALIIVGSQDSSSRRAIAYAEKYAKGVYAAVGLHPVDLIEDVKDTAMIGGQEVTFKSRQEDFDRDKYLAMAKSSGKVKAIGEVGLDYYYFDKYSAGEQRDFAAKQDQVLREFIALAEELSLPLIFHCRGTAGDPTAAYDDLYELISAEKSKGRQISGVVHCFGGSPDQAKKFLSLGLYLGFTGIITFKKGVESLLLIAREAPLDRILIETDAPFLSPEPHRGQRNVPAYVEFVARKIAEVRGVSYEDIGAATTENARRLFAI